MMWRDCAIRVAKTKALISCAVTAQLICVFVFANTKSWFSHDEAQFRDDFHHFSIKTDIVGVHPQYNYDFKEK